MSCLQVHDHCCVRSWSLQSSDHITCPCVYHAPSKQYCTIRNENVSCLHVYNQMYTRSLPSKRNYSFCFPTSLTFTLAGVSVLVGRCWQCGGVSTHPTLQCTHPPPLSLPSPRGSSVLQWVCLSGDGWWSFEPDGGWGCQLSGEGDTAYREATVSSEQISKKYNSGIQLIFNNRLILDQYCLSILIADQICNFVQHFYPSVLIDSFTNNFCIIVN